MTLSTSRRISRRKNQIIRASFKSASCSTLPLLLLLPHTHMLLVLVLVLVLVRRRRPCRDRRSKVYLIV